MTLLEAIAHEEGFYAKGPKLTRAQRNANPGNIEFGAFAIKHGSIGLEPYALCADCKPRFAVFGSPADGFACLRALLLEHYKGMTVRAALNKYAPPVENDTNSYLANVCKWTGINPEDLIEKHLS